MDKKKMRKVRLVLEVIMVKKFVIKGILSLFVGGCASGTVSLYQHYEAQETSHGQDALTISELTLSRNKGKSTAFLGIQSSTMSNKSQSSRGKKSVKAVVDAPISYRDRFPEAVSAEVYEVKPMAEDIGPDVDPIFSEDMPNGEQDKVESEVVISGEQEQDSQNQSEDSSSFFGDYKKPKSSYGTSRDDSGMGNAYIDPLYGDNFFDSPPYGQSYQNDFGSYGMSSQSHDMSSSTDDYDSQENNNSGSSGAKSNGARAASAHVSGSPQSRLLEAAQNSAQQSVLPEEKEEKKKVSERKKDEKASSSEYASSNSLDSYEATSSTPHRYNHQNAPHRQSSAHSGSSSPFGQFEVDDAQRDGNMDGNMSGDDNDDDDMDPQMAGDDAGQDGSSFLGPVKEIAKAVAGMATPLVANKLISSAWQSFCNWYNPAAAVPAQAPVVGDDGQAVDGAAVDGVPDDNMPADQAAVGGGVRAALSRCFKYMVRQVAGAIDEDAGAAVAGVAPCDAVLPSVVPGARDAID